MRHQRRRAQSCTSRRRRQKRSGAETRDASRLQHEGRPIQVLEPGELIGRRWMTLAFVDQTLEPRCRPERTLAA